MTNLEKLTSECTGIILSVVDARTYYSYLEEAMAQDIIRIEVHPTTGKKWVTLTDGQLVIMAPMWRRALSTESVFVRTSPVGD